MNSGTLSRCCGGEFHPSFDPVHNIPPSSIVEKGATAFGFDEVKLREDRGVSLFRDRTNVIEEAQADDFRMNWYFSVAVAVLQPFLAISKKERFTLRGAAADADGAPRHDAT